MTDNTLSLLNSGAVSRQTHSLPTLIAIAALTMLCLLIWVPIAPSLPVWGLDPSWILGLNQAVADGYVFGQDIMFTFGPYSSIYSMLYHPETYGMVVTMALLFAVAYAWMLHSCFGGSKRTIFLGFLVLIMGLFSRDTLLLSYPILFVFAFWNLLIRDRTTDGQAYEGFVPVAAASAGLFALLLVKGSILPLIAYALFAVTVICLIARTYLILILVFASGFASLLTFWVVAGQPSGAIPGYFVQLLSVISGYSEAMAISGRSLDFVIFGVVVAVALTLAVISPAPIALRALRILSFGALGFVAFKAGFVRHDWHATIAMGCAVVILLLGLSFSRLRTLLTTAITALALVGWFNVEANSQSIPAHYLILFKIKQSIADPFITAAARVRDKEYLLQRYTRSLEELNGQFEFPKFAGTVDVYSFWQGDLIASGSDWHPRPTLQSYAANTDGLATANADHLLAADAPDQIALRITPIDGNFPTLADGASWPALLTRYEPYAFKNGFVYLGKRADVQGQPRLNELTKGTAQLGEDIPIPSTTSPIFLEVDIGKTFAGQVMEVLFKPQNLVLEAITESGNLLRYRYVSGMGKGGFLISPLIQNSTELTELYAEGPTVAGTRLAAFRIVGQDGATSHWSNTLSYRFSEVVFENTRQPIQFDYARAVDPQDAIANLVENTDPCLGGVDVLNDVYPAAQRVDVHSILSVMGWLAVPDATVADAGTVFLTITDEAEDSIWIETRRNPRIDVKTMFGDPFGPDLGYDAYVDIDRFRRTHTLGLAWTNGTSWAQCQEFSHQLHFSESL